MISCSFLSTSSVVRESFCAFWDISRPDTATHHALDALPGPKGILFLWNNAIASLVQGILAHSAIYLTSFAMRFFASA
jgi:hypothetical protein